MMAFFFDDADQQNDADEGNDAEFRFAKQKREDGADTGRRKRGKNGDGMDVTFVQNTKDDINGDERGENEQRLIGNGAKKRRGRALERGLHALWHADCISNVVDCFCGVAKRGIGSQVEGNGDNRKLALVIDGQRTGAGLKARKGAQWNLAAVRGMDIDVLQRAGILLEVRSDFHYYVVLVQLGENRGDLALAECVVERVVDIGGVECPGARRNRDQSLAWREGHHRVDRWRHRAIRAELSAFPRSAASITRVPWDRHLPVNTDIACGPRDPQR